MKKKIGILVICVIIFFTIWFINKKNKNVKNEIEQIEYNYFVLYTEQGVGVVDKTGNKIVENSYNEIKIPNPVKPVFFCESEEGIKVINEKNEEIFNSFEEVYPLKISSEEEVYEKNVLIYKENNLYGLLDYNGNKITQAKFSEIKKIKNISGEVIICENEKYGVITKDGTVKIKPEYDLIESDEYMEMQQYINLGYIVANKSKEGYVYGYISNSGKEKINTEYEDLYRVQEIETNDIFIIVMQNGKKGLFKNNKQIIECNYQEILYNSVANIFIVEKNMQYGFYDVNGKEILKPEFEMFSISSKCITANKKNQESKTYNLQGKEMQTEFVNIYELENENYFIGIDKENKYSILNSKFESIVNKKYSYIFEFCNDYLIFVNDENQKGIINLNGEIILNSEYELLYKIDDIEIIQAQKVNSSITEFYTKNLEKITEIENATVSIEKEFIKVENSEKVIYINNNGKIVDEKDVYKNDLIYPYYENGKYGFKDINGNIIKENVYEKSTRLNEYGFAGYKQNDKWGVINEKGEIIIEPIINLDEYGFIFENYEPQFIGEYILVETSNEKHCIK